MTATPEHVALPVDSFKEAAPLLRRPFTAAAVKFKVQATWPKNSPEGGLVVAYIDARLVVERLNLVCPHLWIDEYHPVQGGLMCRLTVDGITRHDIGEGVGKGLWSDALKRAAVKFGVGVSLYAIPQSFISTKDSSAKVKSTPKGPTLVLTDYGEKNIRAAYSAWLESTGIEAFGQPLDHGDAEGHQGDAEADPDRDIPAASTPEVVAEPIDADRANDIVRRAIGIGVADKLQLALSHAHGSDVGDCSTEDAALAAVAQITGPEADKVEAWLNKKAEVLA